MVNLSRDLLLSSGSTNLLNFWHMMLVVLNPMVHQLILIFQFWKGFSSVWTLRIDGFFLQDNPRKLVKARKAANVPFATRYGFFPIIAPSVMGLVKHLRKYRRWAWGNYVLSCTIQRGWLPHLHSAVVFPRRMKRGIRRTLDKLYIDPFGRVSFESSFSSYLPLYKSCIFMSNDDRLQMLKKVGV